MEGDDEKVGLGDKEGNIEREGDIEGIEENVGLSDGMDDTEDEKDMVGAGHTHQSHPHNAWPQSRSTSSKLQISDGI